MNPQLNDDSQDKVMERWERRLILRDPVGLVLRVPSKIKRTRDWNTEIRPSTVSMNTHLDTVDWLVLRRTVY